jgi:hypothetical protein
MDGRPEDADFGLGAMQQAIGRQKLKITGSVAKLKTLLIYLLCRECSGRYGLVEADENV